MYMSGVFAQEWPRTLSMSFLKAIHKEWRVFRRSRRTRLKHHHSGFWLFECTMLRIWLNRILITTHNNMLVLFIINVVVVVLAVFIIQLQQKKNLARFF